jgi:hypothetical protein
VPALIAAVNGNQLNPTQRAYALGLLFSITEQQNPMDVPNLLGPFEYRHSGVVEFGGHPGSGQAISSQAFSVVVGKIDPQAQMEFAKSWTPWIEKGYLKVIQADKPDAAVK